MIRFANTYYLYLLLLLPVFIGLFILLLRTRKKALQRFGQDDLVQQLMPEYSFTKPLVKFIILMLAFSLITIGLARPQYGSKLIKMKRKGIELIVALDVSNSMNAEDIQPSRMERAKQAISKLVERLDNDRIGLIVFAGDAYTQIPITTDYVSAKMFLNTINSSLVPRQGTSIGKAITMASHSFSPESQLKKVIIVITDGETHDDDPMDAAKQAKDKGIVISTIGIGSPDGSPIPVSARSSDFMKDKEGNVVVSKLDEATLSQIAKAGGGIYVRANNTQFGLNTIFEEIDNMDRKEYEATIYSDYNEQFRYFFFPALLLLLLEFFLSDRRSKLWQRIKLFDVK